MVKAHSPINWENEPSQNTPVNETNLNKMDSTIGVLDDRIIAQDTIKLDKATANTMVKAISFDENTGVFTITLLNGSTTTIDTKLEKVVVNFGYDANTQQIILNLVDGTTQYIDLSALITQYEFLDSNTISWEVTTDGKVKANVLDGSITENMLQPNYLAEIKVETAKSAQSMANAKISENNAKQSELNAKASEEQALEYSNNAKPLAQSVTGDDPTITNSTDGNVIYLKNDGYTEQQTLSGKNLLNPALNVTTAYGVECTDNGDGTYILNGTATQDATFFLYNSTEPLTDIKGKLRLVGCPSGGSSNTFGIGIANTSWLGGNDVGNGMTIDTNTHTPNRVYIFVKSGVTLNGKVFKPMVTTDTTATYEDFEPYCGGIASPNPDYPQHIDGLGDKGYFDGELLQGYYNYGVGDTASFVSSSSVVCNKNYIACKSGDTITLEYETNATLRTIFADENMKSLFTSSLDSTKTTVTAPENTKYFLFVVGESNITPSTAKHISVTINGQYAIRVKTCGNNLLKVEPKTVTANKCTFIFNEDGSITASGTNPNDWIANTIVDTIKLKAGTYTMSQNVTGTTNPYLYVVINREWHTLVSNKSRTFTLTEDTEVIVYVGVYNKATVTNATIYPQLELGEVATDYEPYTETIALIPVSSPLYDGDYIEVYADGSGQIVRENGSVVYDGSQSGWSQYNNEFIFTISDAKAPANNNSVANLYCSHFTNTSRLSMGNGLCSMSSSKAFLIQDTNKFNTVDELKTWLQSNPITVVYELATPTETPLTAEQVAEFMKLQTFKPVTHVTADGEVTIRYYCNNDSGETVSMLHEMVEDTQNQIDTKLNGIFKIVEVGTVLGGMQPGDIHKDLYIDINRFIEDGYLPISISGYNVDKSDVNLYRLEINTTEGKIYFSLYNTSSEFALASVSLDIKVLLVKEEFFAN